MHKPIALVCAAVLFCTACGNRMEDAQSVTAPASSATSSATSSAIPTPPKAPVPKPESTVSESIAPEHAAIQASSAAISSGALPVSSAPTSSEAPPRTTTITIPEGYTLARVGMLLEEKGLCTVQELIDASQSADLSAFPLIAAQEPNVNRCFRLEGYLFPDTYELYTTDTPVQILSRILTHTEQKWTSELRLRAAEWGLTVEQTLTLASIIEKEAYGAEQMPMISAVLHNRLREGMQLQCDVTITYVEGAIKPFITGDINRYNSSYNTYKCPALPAGPICNPGMYAIEAALAPADHDALFFVTDKVKNYYYADTWEEHLENVERAGITVPASSALP